MHTDIFDGQIMGVGTSRGTRIVVGDWFTSPLGRFTDVMVAHPDGRRELLAPSEDVAGYVSATYHFDDVLVCPIEARGGHASRPSADGALASPVVVQAGPLHLEAEVGARHPWGYLLAAVPARVRGPMLARLANPAARLVMPGVRTYGSAKGGRTEAYVARDLHRVAGVDARWEQRDLGSLTPVEPAPNFGFSSSPKLPSLTRVTTFVCRG